MLYILSHADSKISQTFSALSEQNHIEYALDHGYVSLFDRTNTLYADRDSRWRKVECIREALLNPDVEFIVWMDYDAFFVSDVPIDYILELLPKNGSIYFSKSPHIAGAPYINSGVFFIRNTDFSKKFFTDVWEKGVLDESMYDTQTYGFSCPGGDQNTIIHVLHTQYVSALGRDIHIVDYWHFNQRPEDISTEHSPYIIHIAGGDKEERWKKYKGLI